MRKLIQNLFKIQVSHDFPNSLLLYLCISYGIDLIRGFLCYGRPKVFVGKKSRFFGKKRIKFGEILKISENVFIDATCAKDGFGVTLGDNCSIGINTRIECTGSLSFLGKGFKCGNNCGLGTDSFYGCAGGIEIGNDVIVGNFVSMHSENHNFSDPNTPIRLQGVNHKGIKIGDNCWIGAKATILDGSRIGNGCIVAAGAIVTGIFPDNSIIAGVPAKVIKSRI